MSYTDRYTRSDWQLEVAQGNTVLGFKEWLEHIQEEIDDEEKSDRSEKYATD